MDAARAVMGQGWPFAAGPWNNDSVHEPCRRQGRMPGRVSFAYFSLHEQRKVRRPRGRNTSHQRTRCNAEYQSVAAKAPHTNMPRTRYVGCGKASRASPLLQVPAGTNAGHKKARPKARSCATQQQWLARFAHQAFDDRHTAHQQHNGERQTRRYRHGLQGHQPAA